MSMVHASSGLVRPPSDQLKSEVAIVCGIAKATLPADGLDWSEFEGDYDVIRDRIEAVFPDLFHDFNRRIRQPGGFHLRLLRASGFGTRRPAEPISSYSRAWLKIRQSTTSRCCD